ncbi:hypothetical protein Tco_0434109, partial [Tanacetum coccineum]
PLGSSLFWEVLAVSVEVIQSNPSPPLCLDFISPLKGFVGLCVLTGKGVIRVMGRWEVVRDSCRGVLERWFGAENRGRGWYGFWRQGSGLRTVMVGKV